VMHYIGD